MRILFLTSYFEPDHGPASIRNTLVANALSLHPSVQHVHVVTMSPNRWDNPHLAKTNDSSPEIRISRVEVGAFGDGLFGQLRKFFSYAKGSFSLSKNQRYDLVYASSSKLGTATLGAYLSKKIGAAYYLDLRDLFVDTINAYYSRWYFKPLTWMLSCLNSYSIKSADRINVLSSGFLDDVRRINSKANISSISHGVDPEFCFTEKIKSTMPFLKNPHKILVYAGNVGFGQALEKFIPELAPVLPDSWVVKVYGGGSGFESLTHRTSGFSNIYLHNPIPRKELIEVYKSSSVLFLNLNDLLPFEKSLPSKFFEYIATGKPVLVGAKGALVDFIYNNDIPGVFVFQPMKASSFISALSRVDSFFYDRKEFLDSILREKKVELMVDDIVLAGR